MADNKVVVKVGTSTLTYENGKINYRRIEKLCKVLADLQNQGKKILLVSSGAIGIGVGKTGLKQRPVKTKEKQAMAAVGQCELMFMYDKLFGEYNHTVAQILLTKYAVQTKQKRQNVINAIDTLLDMDIIPIINENDTVAIDELEGQNIGDNDMLSAIVAKLISADKLIILTDIDGLYDKNPKTHPEAEKIEVVEKIDDNILSMAKGSGSNRGTGGMITKLAAASYVNEAGIDCYVVNGENPSVLYYICDGINKGTLFKGKKSN
ncbi:glutamate 5-kinase [bacterium]|nr:glutamate 5-kinase [bacterium]